MCGKDHRAASHLPNQSPLPNLNEGCAIIVLQIGRGIDSGWIQVQIAVS